MLSQGLAASPSRSLQHELWLQALVLHLRCALTQIFHMPQLILTGWWDEQPQGKVLILTQLLLCPKAVGQALPFLQCKFPLLWLQACSHQHPRLMKPNGLCVMLWSSHDVVDPCVTAFSPSATNFCFFF